MSDAIHINEKKNGDRQNLPMIIGIGASAGGLEALQQFSAFFPPAAD